MIWSLQHQSVENDNSLPGYAQYGYSIPINHYIRSYYNKTNKYRRLSSPPAAIQRVRIRNI